MPFIFLTTLGGREYVLVGLQKGADAYLVKPIDFELLLVTIHASLRQMERVKQMREKLYELGAYQSSLRKLENMKKEREPDVELDI
jgi:DNA-binding response OmpR family regulator